MKNKNHPQWGSQGKTKKTNNRITKNRKSKTIVGLFYLLSYIPNSTETRYARRLLSRDEYIEKMRRYEQRAQLNLSLFDNSSKRYNNEPKVYCGGCGKIPEKKTHIQRYGWKSEQVKGYVGSKLVISWCPDCQKLEE